MSKAPIPLTLDLWANGHSAADIGRKLGIARRTISLIVEQARDIGDVRAALHVGKNGRPIGRPDRARRVLLNFPDVELVPAIQASHCKRGHPRNAETVNRWGDCRVCKRITATPWSERK